MHKVIITARAEKDLNSIENSIRIRILKKLKEYSSNPFDYSEKITNKMLGTYRFRIGDYRAIADIDGDEIIILRVGHRKEIYR
ncbi:MAG: type II toxin-antitoxin system RelE/ParE family toxin [Bacteroidetes bacterium]|nr:type II toxin-antitoxin system RelE/ParE family toxin [Bacteroidota bacterium]